MNRSYRILLIALVCLVLSTATACAQFEDYWGAIEMTTTCDYAEVTLTVTFNPWTDPPPADWVGWIVERTVVGKCVPDVRVGDVRPLPTEPTEFVIVDTVEEIGYDVLYRAYGVNAAGERLNQLLFPYRKYFQHAACAGGPSYRGTVRVIDGQWFVFDTCEGHCWWGLSHMDGSYSDEFLDYDGQTLDLYGELRAGMHGVYIDVDFWFVSPNGCGPVGTRETSWGALKTRYR